MKIGLGTCVHRHQEDYDILLEREHRIEIIRYALEAGITYIDTAPSYGNRLSDSQACVGEAIADRPRASFTLTTKSQVGTEWVTDKDKNLAFLQKRFDESLERLKTNYFDNYLLHDIPMILETPDAITKCVEEIQRYKELGLIKGGIGVGTVDIEIAKAVLEQGWADIIQLGGGCQSYMGGDLNEHFPHFIEGLQNQGIRFINCQLFCCIPEPAPPDFHRDALIHSLDTSFVDMSVMSMWTKEVIDENIAVYESHTV